jgi:uncharacterized membrane protein
MSELFYKRQTKDYQGFQTNGWWWIHSEHCAKSVLVRLIPVDTGVNIRYGASDVS